MQVRRHLRLWAALALILQSTWLLALVPRDCCAAHRVGKTQAEATCHEQTPAHCPTAAAAGEACHLDAGHPVPAADPCRMRGACDGPMSVMMTLLSAQGVIPSVTTLTPDLAHGRVAPAAREQLATRFVPPDSPPPRG